MRNAVQSKKRLKKREKGNREKEKEAGGEGEGEFDSTAKKLILKIYGKPILIIISVINNIKINYSRIYKY